MQLNDFSWGQKGIDGQLPQVTDGISRFRRTNFRPSRGVDVGSDLAGSSSGER